MAPPSIPTTLQVSIIYMLRLFSLLCFLSSSPATTTISACYAPDRASLLSFARDVHFNGLNATPDHSDPGDHTDYEDYGTLPWQGDDCCSWVGITCSDASVPPTNFSSTTTDVLRVTELSLVFWTAVSMSIPASLCNLSALTFLELEYTDVAMERDFRISDCVGTHLTRLNVLILLMPVIEEFTTTIPVSFSLEFPTTIPVSFSLEITTTIPVSFSRLSNLQTLHLEGLRIDSQESLHSLVSPSSLSTITLTECALARPASSLPVFTSLPNLTDLSLKSCSLSGPVPAFNTTPLLERLDLSDNFLNSTLEDFVLHSNLPALSLFVAESNNLSGSLPAFASQRFPNLESLFLGQNQLSGPFPSFGEIAAPSSLQELVLFGNRFNGAFPEEWQYLSNLTYLDLSGNSIANSIPNWLFRLPLEVLYLASTSLQNRDFVCQGMLSLLNQTLRSLDLSGNSLTGPDIVNCFARHKFYFLELNLSNNPLDFDLSSLSDQQFLTTFTTLDLSHCRLHGPLTHLPTKEYCNPQFDGVAFDTLDLSDNMLTGEVPSCDLKRFQRVLMSNNLLRSISDELGAVGAKLTTLKLNDNRLVGDIPPSILNITFLQLLDLRNNHLQGDLTALFSWVKHPTQLRALLLSNNNLTGSIPPASFGAFTPHLQLIDLSTNKLSGVIPWNLSLQAFLPVSARIPSLDKLYEEVRVVVKGSFITYTYELSVLTLLDFSDNHLTGAIPSQFGNFGGLRYLNLSRNMLSGSIPASLSKLGVLESMDLSFNQLQGQIPAAFSKLDSLEDFDVSYNEALQGPIPFGSSFEDNRSFQGDPGLCGSPILEKCNSSMSKEEEEVDEHTGYVWRWINRWIALPALCLGMVVGFVGTLVLLHVKSSPFHIMPRLCCGRLHIVAS